VSTSPEYATAQTLSEEAAPIFSEWIKAVDKMSAIYQQNMSKLEKIRFHIASRKQKKIASQIDELAKQGKVFDND